MSFGILRSKRSKILTLVALLLVAISVPIIGPFTFYKDVVPYLGPVLPKPEGAPSDAQPQFHWKGFGLSWHWKRELPSGCATWTAAEGRYIGARLKNDDCGSDGPSLGFSNFLDDDDIDFNPISSQSFHCSIHTADQAPEAVAEASTLLAEAKSAAKSEAEERLIELSQRFLVQPKPADGEHPCGEDYAELLRAAGKWP
ncbi:MAG: hypothetical protein AAGK01_03885 [Pseudomonadota bacterium]